MLAMNGHITSPGVLQKHPLFCDVDTQVCKEPKLQDWQLYLVDWGYNTAEERQRAQDNPRIELLSLGDSLAQATGTA